MSEEVRETLEFPMPNVGKVISARIEGNKLIVGVTFGTGEKIEGDSTDLIELEIEAKPKDRKEGK